MSLSVDFFSRLLTIQYLTKKEIAICAHSFFPMVSKMVCRKEQKTEKDQSEESENKGKNTQTRTADRRKHGAAHRKIPKNRLS